MWLNNDLLLRSTIYSLTSLVIGILLCFASSGKRQKLQNLHTLINSFNTAQCEWPSDVINCLFLLKPFTIEKVYLDLSNRSRYVLFLGHFCLPGESDVFGTRSKVYFWTVMISKMQYHCLQRDMFSFVQNYECKLISFTYEKKLRMSYLMLEFSSVNSLYCTGTSKV